MRQRKTVCLCVIMVVLVGISLRFTGEKNRTNLMQSIAMKQNGALLCLSGALPEASAAQETTDSFSDESSYRVRILREDEKKVRFLQPQATPEPEILPTIVIYHTHTHEAYNPLDGKAYTEKTGRWRTTDNDYNIVKVGETLTEYLKKEGFTVYHDTTDYEMPSLGTAYSRSLKGVKALAEAHPEISVFIDVHRDAYTDGRIISVPVDGEDCAQIMFVVGSGQGTGFSDLPDTEANKALAQKAMDALSTFSPDLVRRMSCKTGRYNQHLSDHCMLIEVGHNMNTLEEALASLPYLAEALKTALSDA